jgi:sortase (surface protein transpeptidase)
VPLGLRDDGAMEVPEAGLAGWYRPGPRPGAAGPAVIAAHVDHDNGPDVFHRLHELRVGDGIAVTDVKDIPHRFVVVGMEQTPKDALPVERIWSDDDDAVLRLITCGGKFDHGSGHYRDNIVVYAEAADEDPTGAGRRAAGASASVDRRGERSTVAAAFAFVPHFL